MSNALLIADDLTGALDSAVAFAERGMRVVAALDVAHLPHALEQDADVVAVSTGSRELTPDEARATMAVVSREVHSFPGILFKKVDSRLKGPIAAELDVLSPTGSLPVLACPAIPRLGRYVIEGAVTGAGVESPVDVRSAIGRAAAIPDAISDADIDAALPDDLDHVLFVGSAGLAEALSRRLMPLTRVPPPLRVTAPALWGIGSRDPVTLVQLHALQDRKIVEAPNGGLPHTEPSAATIVQLVGGGETVSPHKAIDRFAEGLGRLVLRDTPATLFACGGETASAIMACLGITLLEIKGEILPGVPVSRACDGVPGLTVVTKSGGFGEADTLQRLAKLTIDDEGPLQCRVGRSQG